MSDSFLSEDTLSSSPRIGKRSHLSQKLLLAISCLIIIIAVLGAILFFWKSSHKISLTTNQPVASPSSNKLTASSLNLLYPPYPSQSGREVYYSYSDLKSPQLPFSSVGVFYYPVGAVISSGLTGKGSQPAIKVASSSAFLSYIVGDFDHWETIPNSTDRYLILKDNFNMHRSGHALVFPKVRVNFTPFNKTSNTFPTTLGVENLSSVLPVTVNKHGIVTNILGPIDSLTYEQLHELIQPGDVIGLTFSPNATGSGDLTDNNGVNMVSFMYIRRFNSAEEIKTEIGKEFLK